MSWEGKVVVSTGGGVLDTGWVVDMGWWWTSALYHVFEQGRDGHQMNSEW
jgi:hypothetical protein